MHNPPWIATLFAHEAILYVSWQSGWEHFKGGWGSLVMIHNTLPPLTSQYHEVSVESVCIPFIRPVSTPCAKYPHPALPASQPPTLWSVSCFQILTEGEDINSEGSYGGQEGGQWETEYLMRSVVRETVTFIIFCKCWLSLVFFQLQETDKIRGLSEGHSTV